MFIYPALNYFLQMIRELFHTDVSDFSFERFQLGTPARKATPDRLIPKQWETQVMVGSGLGGVLMGTQPPPPGSKWLLSGQSPREIK